MILISGRTLISVFINNNYNNYNKDTFLMLGYRFHMGIHERQKEHGSSRINHLFFKYTIVSIPPPRCLKGGGKEISGVG